MLVNWKATLQMNACLWARAKFDVEVTCCLLHELGANHDCTYTLRGRCYCHDHYSLLLALLLRQLIAYPLGVEPLAGVNTLLFSSVPTIVAVKSSCYVLPTNCKHVLIAATVFCTNPCALILRDTMYSYSSHDERGWTANGDVQYLSMYEFSASIN